MCRIDTLEKPSLRPKCVGFAALKLFIDENGCQPLPDHKSHNVFLNAGQYLLPIVHGTVPAEGLLCETLMDSLPHIYDAYLSVRLFDPHVENEKSAVGNLTRGIDEALATDRDFSKFIMHNSVASSVVHALPFAHESVVPPAISEVILNEIKRGVELDPGEKKVVIRQCNEWLARQFPPVVQKISPIDHRFMIRYENRVGSYVALDMLFNMPHIPKFIKATQAGISQLPGQGLFRKPWDNRVAFFKTYFRYLPGSTVPKKLKSSPTDLVIDDASVDLDFASKEFSPVYLDEFSRTAGFELSVNACLLVVVSMVDVLTGRKYTNHDLSPYVAQKLGEADAALAKSLKRPMSRADVGIGGMYDAAHEEERNAIRVKQEQAFKLRGVVGMYFGHDDEAATWWGIVPLMLDCPFEKGAKRGAGGSGGAATGPGSAGTAPTNSRGSDGKAGSRGYYDGVPQSSPARHSASYAHLPKQQHSEQPLHSTQSKYGKQTMVSDTAHGLSRRGESKLDPSVGKQQSKYQISTGTGAGHGNNNWVGSPDPASPPDTGSSAPGSGAGRSASPVVPFSIGGSSSGKDGGGGRGGTGGGHGGTTPGSSDGSRGDGMYFVNSGTHQVPLFRGLPPKDMLHSSNPMAWLISSVGQQAKEKALSGGCCGTGASSSAVVADSNSKKKASRRIGPNDLQLSAGASAMVSIVDPRLRQFCHDSIVRSAHPDINQDTLQRILKVKSSRYDKRADRMMPPDDQQFRKLFAEFQFDVSKFARLRSLDTAVPPNILQDALMSEINATFTQTMSE